MRSIAPGPGRAAGRPRPRLSPRPGTKKRLNRAPTLSSVQEDLASLLQAAAIPIHWVDADGTIIWANAEELDMLGYEPHEYIGRHISEFHVDREAIGEVLDRVKRGESVRQRAAQLRRKDGAIRDVLIDTNILWGDGEFVHTSCFTHDITDLWRAEEALLEERERLNLAMKSGVMGAWEWDVASGRVTWSETLEAIHGLAPGAFGQTFEDYVLDIHPADRARVLETAGRSLETGSHELEYRIIWPDGSVRWLSARGRVTRDRSGKPIKMTGICADVTERRRRYESERFLAEATATLAASSLDYSMTLASLARLAVPRLADWCGIDVLEDDGTVTQVALAHEDPSMVEKARDLSRRYPFDPEAGYGLALVLRTGEPEFYPDISEQVLHEVVGDEKLIKIIRSAGLRSLICAPLLARGRTLGAITLATAESGRRYDEQDLALAQELARRAGLAVDNARLYGQMLKANEAKDEFLGLISHELRTPITTIYGGARVLQTRGHRLDDESKDRILNDIERESERLSRMVENLLALARIDLGQEAPAEPVVARRVVQKIAASFMQRRPGREVELESDDGAALVAAQPVYLEQVVRNLLTNADKYSPEGEPIEVRLRSVDGGVECSVLDRGPGVEPDQLDMIFERFYRSDHSSRGTKGAGLGLTVCKRLVEAQGGRIWARPRDGGGLEVGFVLPRYDEPDA